MNPDTTYTRMLRRAIEIIGSEAKLAEQLRTSPEVLSKWLSGELQPSTKAHLAAIAILARAARKPALKQS
jgi:hypothetical protein